MLSILRTVYIFSRKSYVTGYTPTQDDASYFDAMGKVDAKSTPNIYRWYLHIASFSPAERTRWPGTYTEVAAAAAEAAPVEEKKAAPVEEKKAAPAADADDDDDDLFGDDDDLFDEDADAAAEARIAAAAAAHNAKKQADMIAKGKTKARTLLSYQFEIKPLEAGQDMDDLAVRIKTLSHDGIKTWGVEHKIVDVAFGIQKIVCQVIIFEDSCCEDDIVELVMESHEDEVQSVDLIAMTKL